MDLEARNGTVHHVAEWSLVSELERDDPFNQVTVDLLVTDPGGREQVIPAFWAGGTEWRVRYAPAQAGRHLVSSRCSDADDSGLHGCAGELHVTEVADETNPLLRHGPIRVAAGSRHLEHADGTPFLWLADTWWMGLCRRLRWPDEFHALTADRAVKGFNVVQLVAGLYPDMEPFDERGAGDGDDGGFPWRRDFSTIEPAYFDAADRRIAHLVESGIVPCVVGFWGYYLEVAGVAKLQAHWRNLIARWGAYPVVWCVCGEALMPFYRSAEFERMKATMRRGERWLPAGRRATWSELARFIKGTDGHRRPLTIHPTRVGTEQVDDPAVLDLHWLQTGHNGYPSTEQAVAMVEQSRAREPALPVIDSEGNYEGIRGTNRDDVQRFQFWSTVLSGAAGYSYGANGIWQVDRSDRPYGTSPHGTSWGGRPWDEAAALPGAAQVGVGKRVLERFPWWRCEPYPEWVEPHQHAADRHLAYAAGIPGKLRILYLPCELSDPVTVCGLEAGLAYDAELVHPETGEVTPLGAVTGDAEGRWQVPPVPVFRDWLLVLERLGTSERLPDEVGRSTLERS